MAASQPPSPATARLPRAALGRKAEGPFSAALGLAPVVAPMQVSRADRDAIERSVAAAVARHFEADRDGSRSSTTSVAAPDQHIIFRSPANEPDPTPAEVAGGGSGGSGDAEEKGNRIGRSEMERIIDAVEERVLCELERRGGRFAEVR